MARPRPYGGSVVKRRRKTGLYYGIRFVAGGERRFQTLGPAADGWTERKAEEALQNVMTDVRRGAWVDPNTPEPEPVPTFRRFASDWFDEQKRLGGRKGRGLTDAGAADLEWRLSVHLLPWFADKQLDEITVADVDRFRLAKLREGSEIEAAAAKGEPVMLDYMVKCKDGTQRRHRRAARPLSATSINKILATLSAILDVAEERELIARNPAKGKRRRLPRVTPRRSWLDRADHIAALLASAGTLDEAATTRAGQRRALLATLVFAGLRIGEALDLRWRDVDLARKTIKVRDAKTEAGVRTVYVLPVLYDELVVYRMRAEAVDATRDALVFGTSTGRRQGATNVRRRILTPAVQLANELLEDGAEPLPAGLTPHSLRRTFASLLFAIGEPPPYVMAQMGHTTPNLTLAIYARQMDRRDGEPERLKALVNGEEWARQAAPAANGGHPAGTRGAAVESAGA